MSALEFSRPVDHRRIARPHQMIEASEAERKALAKRFGLVSIDRLEAELDLEAAGEVVNVTGRLRAAIVQSCAVSGDDLPVSVDEPVAIRFVPERAFDPDEEIELEEEDCDEIEYADHIFDLGEAVAQSLSLAIDPYLTGPNAEVARKEAGLLDENASGPFAALAALKGKE